MEYVIMIAVFVVLIPIVIVVRNAQAAAVRGINRAIRSGTVAKEKELTLEVLTARVSRISVGEVKDALGVAMSFHQGPRPMLGGVFAVDSVDAGGFTFGYGDRVGWAFKVAVRVVEVSEGQSDVSYTVTNWYQVNGVSELNKMMESARSAFIYVAASLPGAKLVTRTKDGVQTTIWALHGASREQPRASEAATQDSAVPAIDESPASVSEVVEPSAQAAVFERDQGAPGRTDSHESQVAQRVAQGSTNSPARASELGDLEETLISPRAFMTLRWDDGTETSLAGPIAIGRNPSAVAGATRTAAIEDSTFSLSKTHFVVVPSRGSLTVTDLHSTNGLSVERDGVQTKLEAGQASPLKVGDTLVMGERRCVVGRDSSRT